MFNKEITSQQAKGKGSGTDEIMDNQKLRFEIHTKCTCLLPCATLQLGLFEQVPIHPETGGSGGGQKAGGSQNQAGYPQIIKMEIRISPEIEHKEWFLEVAYCSLLVSCLESEYIFH